MPLQTMKCLFWRQPYASKEHQNFRSVALFLFILVNSITPQCFLCIHLLLRLNKHKVVFNENLITFIIIYICYASQLYDTAPTSSLQTCQAFVIRPTYDEKVLLRSIWRHIFLYWRNIIVFVRCLYNKLKMLSSPTKFTSSPAVTSPSHPQVKSN